MCIYCAEAKELKYVYTRGGVRVWWEEGAGGVGGARIVRVVRYAQNITRPVEHWHARNVSDTHVEVTRPKHVLTRPTTETLRPF